MATRTTNRITLRGKSGSTFDFEVYPWGQEFRPVGGVYVVLSSATDGIIYIGQTGDLSERFDAHHKADCFTLYGKTHLGVYQEGVEARRLAIESDLIVNYRPPCNEKK